MHNGTVQSLYSAPYVGPSVSLQLPRVCDCARWHCAVMSCVCKSICDTDTEEGEENNHCYWAPWTYCWPPRSMHCHILSISIGAKVNWADGTKSFSTMVRVRYPRDAENQKTENHLFSSIFPPPFMIQHGKLQPLISKLHSPKQKLSKLNQLI